MGKRGPTPDPIEILKLKGTYRKDRHGGTPQPKVKAPPCPAGLCPDGKKVWRNLTKHLLSMRLISEVDWPQLERYCIFFIRWRQCEQFIEKHGTTYPVKADNPDTYVVKPPDGGPCIVGWKLHPHVRESENLDHILKQIEANFGLTPSARARIRPDAPENLGGGVRARVRESKAE